MKSLYLFLSIIFVFLISNQNNSYCQWQQDVRLTNDVHESITSSNNSRCIAVSNHIVHVVWADGASGDWRLHYKRSTDEGVTWGAPMLITNDPGTDGAYDPCITVSGSFVYVAWTDIRFRPNWEIYFKRSADEGLSWGNAQRLTEGSELSRNPSITASGSFVHLVWSEDNYALYKRSTDGGVTWGSGLYLSTGSLTNGYPSVSVSGSNAHVVWSEINEIYYRHSTNEGVSWDSAKQLTNDMFNSWSPSVSASGQNLSAVWYDLRDGNYEIYHKQSMDGGVTWGADTRISYGIDVSYSPSVFRSGSDVHIVWYDARDYDYEIYYRRSLNGGINWESETRLTYAIRESFNPSIAVSDTMVHVVWYDNRHSNTEIYYKRNPEGGKVFTLELTAFIEGFYNISSDTMEPDTVKIFLRNNFTPYTIMDSTISVLNQSGSAAFYFGGIYNGTNYYIVIRHRNSIETWSGSGVSFSNRTLNYDFTSEANKAYGNNLKQIDTAPLRFAIYSGDVNQDGVIETLDLGSADNDAFNFVTGYVNTDVNGNNVVDANDLAIIDNNVFNFVSKVTPP